MRVKRRNDPNVRAFWTRHVALWMRGPFSQREYYARNGISRSLMSKWWIWLREDRAREERIKIARCRGRGRLSTMTKELSHRPYVSPNMSPAAVLKLQTDRPVVRRRRFTEDEKRHFLDLANQPGSSVSDVAQRYDLSLSLLFRWRKELSGDVGQFAGFTAVEILDDVPHLTPGRDSATGQIAPLSAPGRSSGGMEIALKDGKCVRVDADPDAVRRLIMVLEGASS